MTQYLSLFDAAGRLSSLRDAEYVAALQLMGRMGAVRGARVAALLLAAWGGGGVREQLVQAARLRRRAGNSTLPSQLDAPPARAPVPAPPRLRPRPRQVLSPVQKARIAAASHPHFPDTVQLVRQLAEHARRAAQQEAAQRRQDDAQEQGDARAGPAGDAFEQPGERVWPPPHLP